MAGTVLCGVNESEGAISAVNVAGELSKRLELRLVLAYVAKPITAAEGSGGTEESATTTQTRNGGKLLLERLSAERGLGGVEQRIEVGDPAQRLAEVAAEERAALIFVGARMRRHRWTPSLRRDLSRELARLSPCPVLVVPPARNDPAGREPLVAVG
jgi:nucleotide-binding universal stress UspA family protein